MEPDPMGETWGDGPLPGDPLAEIDGGTGDEARDVGSEFDGDMVGVVIGRVKSG